MLEYFTQKTVHKEYNPHYFLCVEEYLLKDRSALKTRERALHLIPAENIVVAEHLV